jgi:hypothetical protein
MCIAKSRVVNLFILLGLPKAAKWNDEILTGKIATLHELFKLDMKTDKRYRKLFKNNVRRNVKRKSGVIIDCFRFFI